MENDKAVRDAILLLVNACNDYQIRILSLTSALLTLQLHPTENGKSHCECELQVEALRAYTEAEATVEDQAKELKAALGGSGPFLDVLTKFATRHYLDFKSSDIPCAPALAGLRLTAGRDTRRKRVNRGRKLGTST